MELHKELIIDKNKYNISLNDNYLIYFSKAREFVLENYKNDYNRIAATKFNDITPEFMFREICWVICTSGFNAKVVSKFFPQLLKALRPLFDMINGKINNINSIDIMMNVIKIFNNKRKVKAFIDSAFILHAGIEKFGWEIYRNTKLNSVDGLKVFPFIGDITKFHLARNCAIEPEAVKPDVHLERAAEMWGFATPLKMCKEIQKTNDLPLGLIDLILWYSFSTFGSIY